MNGDPNRPDAVASLADDVAEGLSQLDAGKTSVFDGSAVERIKSRGRAMLAGTFPRTFFLRSIDPATASIADEVRFEVKNDSELARLRVLSDAELVDRATYSLRPAEVDQIIAEFGLSFAPSAMPVEIWPWRPVDDRPYTIHTNRELALMLAGTKPLAVFMDLHPALDPDIIPEEVFEPHVVAGRIIKRTQIVPPGPDDRPIEGLRRGSRRVLYALPGQEWRIDAYLLLWQTSAKTGWNEGFERMEGALLGYEDWQNDFHIEEQRRRKAKRDADK